MYRADTLEWKNEVKMDDDAKDWNIATDAEAGDGEKTWLGCIPAVAQRLQALAASFSGKISHGQ